MAHVYLFDWGDTLMVDFTESSGKMCTWKKIEAVKDAKSTLEYLSKTSKIYIATGASESSVDDIRSAFNQVELDQYITGYFCKANLGIEKGSCEFFKKILDELKSKPQDVTMVGDSLRRDIEPALKLGLNVAWFCPNETATTNQNIRVIASLSDLC
ncbi:MAG: HAD hydrolase-like protein [Campylobacteraceae bacterium]|nr:HAD hydrolase-like protein [Campylobacteraceae bacterium]